MSFFHCHITIVQRTEIKNFRSVNRNVTSYHGESNLTFEGFAWQQNCRTGSLTILMRIWNMEGVNGMDFPSEWVSQEQLRGWCPIMGLKIFIDNSQCSSNDKYIQHLLIYWSMAQWQNASISISYGSIRVFCSEASLKGRFFQYIKACFVEYAQLSEQKCLDHISQIQNEQNKSAE